MNVDADAKLFAQGITELFSRSTFASIVGAEIAFRIAISKGHLNPESEIPSAFSEHH